MAAWVDRVSDAHAEARVHPVHDVTEREPALSVGEAVREDEPGTEAQWGPAGHHRLHARSDLDGRPRAPSGTGLDDWVGSHGVDLAAGGSSSLPAPRRILSQESRVPRVRGLVWLRYAATI